VFPPPIRNYHHDKTEIFMKVIFATKSNMTGASSGAGAVYPSLASEFTHGF
jgi:hypothetical protein